MHVEMLLTWQNTREQFGAKSRSEQKSYLTNGRRSTIAVCKSLFDCSTKGASVPEEWRTAWTVGSLRERCSVGVGRYQKRSGHVSDANGS